MAREFFQPGRSPVTRQSSGLPAALGNTSEPRAPTSDTLKNVQPGRALPCVVILTALSEEFLAVEAHLTDVREQEHPDDKTVYGRGQFASGQGVWDVLIVETGQGNASAADETRRAIAYFNPDVVLFVGVAGGLKDVRIGDVVAGTKVYNYASGKDEEVFKTRPDMGRSTYDMEQLARSVRRDWLRRYQADASKLLPRAFVAPIAAGESVVGSTQSGTAQLLQRNYGDALAVEMEGFGFLEAARTSQGLPAIVIRGVSDSLDGKAEADASGSQELAARHASKFAFELLAKMDALRLGLGGGGSAVSPLPNASQTGTEAIAVHTDETIQIPLERQFPRDVAVLYVEEREGKLSLKAFNAEQDSLEPSEACPPPPLLPDELKPGQQISDFLGRLAAYRPRKCAMGQFLRWLMSLRQTLREVANSELSRLIINDRTEFEIPWEMLNLPGNETLGTVVQTVRWRDIDDPETWELMALPLPTPKKHSCRGKVLIHTGAEEKIESNRRIEVLQSYQTVHFSDLHAFFNHLQQAQSEFGLLFIAGREFQCLSKETLKAYLHYTDAMRNNPSVVFIDMQLFPGKQPSMSYRELAASFLECGLKGVIGTLKTLNGQETTQVVQSFFTELDQDRTATVPEILRRLRVKADQRLRQTFNEETCLLYILTCLYAYYGNQMTVLELAPAEDTSYD